MGKKLPVMQETQFRSLRQEGPLEKETAAHSRVLTWGIPCTEEPGGLQSTGWQRVRHDGASNAFLFHFYKKVNQGKKREVLEIQFEKES